MDKEENFGTEKMAQQLKDLGIKDVGQSTKMTCGKRANFERRYREAQYRAATYTVQGWRQSNGSLWKVNSQVRVDDALLGISELLLITKVVLQLSSSGATAELSCTALAGYKRDGVKADDKTSSENSWVGVVK